MRKTGSQNIPKLSSFFTEKELQDYVKELKRRAKKSDKIAVFLAEQIWGKAPQAVEHSGKDGGDIVVKIMHYGDNTTPSVHSPFVPTGSTQSD